ncbi:PilN domain-containing protein [Lysinibacillus sphaericus]
MKLIDINLLPQKEKKQKAFTYSAAGTAGLVVLIALFMLLTWKSTITETKRTEAELETAKKIIEVQQTKVLGAESSGSVDQLNKAVQEMLDYPVKTVPLLNELISLLPDRGFFNEFEYADRTVINTIVQFDSSREAAFYLSRLKTLEWIKEADIIEITTEEAGENEDEKILPRYLASYELHIDQGKLEELLSQEGEEE